MSLIIARPILPESLPECSRVLAGMDFVGSFANDAAACAAAQRRADDFLDRRKWFRGCVADEQRREFARHFTLPADYAARVRRRLRGM